jgi:8-oxo-dGTP diphosphatase
VNREIIVAAVLRSKDKVLLCHRSPTRESFPNVWDFAGGHVEPGETQLEALSRELYEELGVTPIQLSPQPIISLVGDDFDLTVWECVMWSGEVANREPREHDEICWFTRADLAELVMADPTYRIALELLLL